MKPALEPCIPADRALAARYGSAPSNPISASRKKDLFLANLVEFGEEKDRGRHRPDGIQGEGMTADRTAQVLTASRWPTFETGRGQPGQRDCNMILQKSPRLKFGSQ